MIYNFAIVKRSRVKELGRILIQQSRHNLSMIVKIRNLVNDIT